MLSQSMTAFYHTCTAKLEAMRGVIDDLDQKVKLASHHNALGTVEVARLLTRIEDCEEDLDWILDYLSIHLAPYSERESE